MHDHVQNCLVCNGTVVPQLNAPGVSFFFFLNLTLPEDLLTNKGFSLAFSDSNVLYAHIPKRSLSKEKKYKIK